MPGILPMKVIKVGTSAQTRIAQACDRCRSKKIRCDGLRPCTQCSNVGFECKTSDKLSRRAFPRGYTESLEERVRSLENEVRELKDLLDEKDEKIDILSKIYDRSPCRNNSRRPSLTTSPGGDSGHTASASNEQAEVFKIQPPQSLFPGEQADSVYVGTASGRTLVDAFKTRLQESGKQSSELTVDRLFTPLSPRWKAPQTLAADDGLSRPPSRLLSDQMITVYFQEWAPLFPVVHRPTFLALYEKYVSNPDSVQDKHAIAQLNLVFSVASSSNESRFLANDESYEREWSAAMDGFLTEQSMVNLQCLLLAQIYSIQKGDTGRLLHYKSLAIGIAQRLGLHLSQKRFALGALTSETRKKVFWTLYTLDCFSAAYLGLPRAFRDENVHCEYPADVDDEYVTEKGFQPTLPGEFTRLSSALALFRLARILAKVLDKNYCCGPSNELSFQEIASLNEDLDSWSEGLALHLKLDFSRDKPSAQVISSRCPLLSMTYHYVRTLIHRPVVCANLGPRASPSIMAMAASSKHIIQIIQLLDERKLSFTHCLNKNDLLLLSGFGVLFQALNLEPDTKLMRDNQRSVYTVMGLLQRRAAPTVTEFARFVTATVPVRAKGRQKEMASPFDNSLAPSKSDSDLGLSTFEALAARYTLAAKSQRQLSHSADNRPEARATKHSGRQSAKPRQQSSNESSVSPPMRSVTVPGMVDPSQSKSLVTQSSSSLIPNLDYFQFPSETQVHHEPDSTATTATRAEGHHDSTIWEKLLSSLDENQIDNGDDFYHWSTVDTVESPMSLVHSNTSTSTGSSATSSTINSNETNWTRDIWANKVTPAAHMPHPISQSVFSFSDESLASGDEFHAVDAQSTDPEKAFAELMISQFSHEGSTPNKSEEFELLHREITM